MGLSLKKNRVKLLVSFEASLSGILTKSLEDYKSFIAFINNKFGQSANLKIIWLTGFNWLRIYVPLTLGLEKSFLLFDFDV